MRWTDLLAREMDGAYKAATGLLDHLRDEDLAWSPSSLEGVEGTRWMTTAELLQHLGASCGQVMQWFVQESWPSMEPNADTIETLPTVASVQEARDALAADRTKAAAAVAEAGEQRMETEPVTAPWGTEALLGQQLLDCVKHLDQHKGQLFYYLKLLGRPVGTPELWGLGC